MKVPQRPTAIFTATATLVGAVGLGVVGAGSASAATGGCGASIQDWLDLDLGGVYSGSSTTAVAGAQGWAISDFVITLTGPVISSTNAFNSEASGQADVIASTDPDGVDASIVAGYFSWESKYTEANTGPVMDVAPALDGSTFYKLYDPVCAGGGTRVSSVTVITTPNSDTSGDVQSIGSANRTL